MIIWNGEEKHLKAPSQTSAYSSRIWHRTKAWGCCWRQFLHKRYPLMKLIPGKKKKIFKWSAAQWRVRCMGHIINLGVQGFCSTTRFQLKNLSCTVSKSWRKEASYMHTSYASQQNDTVPAYRVFFNSTAEYHYARLTYVLGTW